MPKFPVKPSWVVDALGAARKPGVITSKVTPKAISGGRSPIDLVTREIPRGAVAGKSKNRLFKTAAGVAVVGSAGALGLGALANSKRTPVSNTGYSYADMGSSPQNPSSNMNWVGNSPGGAKPKPKTAAPAKPPAKTPTKPKPAPSLGGGGGKPNPAPSRGKIVSQSDTQWVKKSGQKGYVALKSDLTKAYSGRIRLTAAGTTRVAAGSKKGKTPMGVADYNKKGLNKRGYGPNQRVAKTAGSLNGPYVRKPKSK